MTTPRLWLAVILACAIAALWFVVREKPRETAAALPSANGSVVPRLDAGAARRSRHAVPLDCGRRKAVSLPRHLHRRPRRLSEDGRHELNQEQGQKKMNRRRTGRPQSSKPTPSRILHPSWPRSSNKWLEPLPAGLQPCAIARPASEMDALRHFASAGSRDRYRIADAAQAEIDITPIEVESVITRSQVLGTHRAPGSLRQRLLRPACWNASAKSSRRRSCRRRRDIRQLLGRVPAEVSSRSYTLAAPGAKLPASSSAETVLLATRTPAKAPTGPIF